MTPDLLDDLLDRSSPATRTAAPEEVATMIAAARRESRPQRRRHGARLGVAAGLTALLLAGGGVAVAGGWLWGPDMQNPAHSFAYESPTWGSCELRFGAFEAMRPEDQAAIDAVIDEWFAAAPSEDDIAPLIDEYVDSIEASQAAQEPITDPRLADLNRWTAAEQAVGELLYRALAERGYDGSAGTGVAASAAQVHCTGEEWG